MTYMLYKSYFHIYQISEVSFPQPRAKGPTADTKYPQLAEHEHAKHASFMYY